MDKGYSRSWLALAEACQVLGVNEWTLRQWADSGLVRSFRTPGGHRRFSRKDLNRLVEGEGGGPLGKGQTISGGEAALRRIRRRLHGDHRVSQQWYGNIDMEGRARMRLFGRRLLALAEEFFAKKGRRSDILAEARFIGEEYGNEVARRRLSLRDAVEAYAFFRNSLIDGFRAGKGTSFLDPWQVCQQADLLANEVLLAMVTAYEESTKAGYIAEVR